MLIKITDKCSMGCIHCMSDCTPEGRHMDFSTFISVLDFNSKLTNSPIIISGGEPTEHPDFQSFIGYIISNVKNNIITITTNGLWLTQNIGFLEVIENLKGADIFFQVVIDDRYYPIHIDEKVLEPFSCVTICHGIERIYPQGRALENKLQYSTKACKCFNVRAIPKQKELTDFKELIFLLNLNKKFCSPHIDIDGNIRLGESALCPPCSNIYKSFKEILEDIKNFKCNKCSIANANLPEEYLKFL